MYIPGWRQAAADALSRKKKNMAGLNSLTMLNEGREVADMEDKLIECLETSFIVLGDAVGSAGVKLSCGAQIAMVGAAAVLITWDGLKMATREDGVLA